MADQKAASVGDHHARPPTSAIFPLLGGRSTWRQEHLLPIVATVIAGVTLIALPLPWPHFNSNNEINEAWQVYFVLALYIAILVNYYISRMCGRPRPTWLIAFSGLFTFLMLGTSYWSSWYSLFYDVIPAANWQKSSNVVVQLAGWWFGTGLCEEGFKAWPLFLLALLGAGLVYLSRRTTGRLSARLAGLAKHIGLREPLDGIVLGVASGSGFFVAETLFQYVPGAMKEFKYPGSQAFEGLVLLLGRGLPDIAEHSAWSGLFGYFIGLSVLYPRMAIVLIPFGWLSAAALHAGWDGIDAVSNSNVVILGFWVFVGVLSYGLLGGAIFKAREISPSLAFAAATAAARQQTTAPLTALQGTDGD
jgi:RsiW-degrading membrane proteinase PrsW (M82 family)